MASSYSQSARSNEVMQANSEQSAVLTSDIYLPFSSSQEHVVAVAAELQRFIDEQAKQVLDGYVWHREPPHISISDHPEPHLTLSMRHGGSVEDEWLVVHLILLATAQPILGADRSKSTANPNMGGLIASISDEDGQFLLIEAADVLPSWVNPTNAGGRLWMMDGKLHMISTDLISGDIDVDNIGSLETGRSLRTPTALEFLRSGRHSAETQAPSSFLQLLIERRMPTYPELAWALSTQHNTLVYLPIVAAKCLWRDSQLTADAVEAFLGRDGPADARSMRNLNVFSNQGPLPAAAGKDDTASSFLVAVKMTRRMYVMLSTDRFLPPKVLGSQWREAVLRYWDAVDKGDFDETEGRRRDLGSKLTCGLELLHAHVQQRVRSSPRDVLSSDTVDTKRFIQSLNTMAYFGTEIRDSTEWKLREARAMRLWTDLQTHRQSEHTSDRLSYLPAAARSARLDRSVPPHVDANMLESSKIALEDSDAFMTDLPDGSVNDEDEGAERLATEQISAFSQRLQSFVEGEGDEVGALFQDDEAMSDEDDRKDDREARLAALVPRLPDDQWGATSASNAAKPNLVSPVEEIVTDGAKDQAVSGFSRPVAYDGASDSDESVDDDVLRAGETTGERKERARQLGMEADYREDERRRKQIKDDGDEPYDEAGDERESNSPFGDDDMGNFIEFTRKELGLSEDQFAEILGKRREEGKLVPDFSRPTLRSKANESAYTATTLADDANIGDDQTDVRTFRQQTRVNVDKAFRNTRTTIEEKQAARLRADRILEEAEALAAQGSGQGQKGNDIEDPFERLMLAMDTELAKHSKSRVATNASDSHEQPDTNFDDEMDDIHSLSAEDRELLEKMLHSGPPASLQTLLRKQQDNPLGLSDIERQVMDGMLQSYQAQMGAAGPVGGMAGRLGFSKLPRHS